MFLRAGALAALLACAACTHMPAHEAAQPSCRVGDALVETQLFFGMSKPKGGVVSARAFDAFVAREIAPRFPEGFTVLDGAGFWQDGTTRRTISEKSKVIVRLHAGDEAADQAIGTIITAYKTAFEQEAVLRVDRPVCARF
jgi:hypothetical protein